MGCPHYATLLIDELEHVGSRTEVINLAIARFFLGIGFSGCERLGMGEVNRLWKEQIPVAAEIRIYFFRRHHQEVLVRQSRSGIEIDLLLLQAQWTGIGLMRVIMEIT